MSVTETHGAGAGSVVDAIEFEVIRNALVAAADEMCIALARSAYSTNIKTRLDLSCALLDRRGRVIGNSAAQPIQLSTLNVVVRRSIESYGVENLEPGDQIAVNDPYQGAQHLNDVILIAPVYYGGDLVGYTANLAHHVDVGGGAPGSLGAFQEIYQEGLIFPVVKVAARGRLQTDVYKLLMANIRSKKETAGDFRAQVAANNLGARRLVELLDRFGVARFERFLDELLAYTERRAREELRKLPEGVYEAEELLDDDGITDEPVRLKGKLTIADGTATFDLTGCDPQRPSPMNSTYALSYGAAVYVVRCLIDRDVPANDGFYRLIDVIAPEGTVAHATVPAGVAGGAEVATRMCDLWFKALAPAIPHRVPAGCKAMICHAAFGGIDPRTREYYCFLETVAGGYGGRFGKNGIDAVQTHHQNTQNAPVEELEVGYPVFTPQYGLIPDSEGPGKYRGGLGLRRDYQFLGHEPVFTILADRRKFPPFGLFGGKPGKVARYLLVGADGQARELPSKVTLPVRKGESIRYETCGGGGYGDPFDRDPQSVLRDVLEGKTSAQRARDEYGVAVDPDLLTIDEEATLAIRRQRTEVQP